MDKYVTILQRIKDIKNEIEKLKQCYPECVKKYNLDNMWNEAAIKFDEFCLDEIDCRIQDGKQIIDNYEVLNE